MTDVMNNPQFKEANKLAEKFFYSYAYIVLMTLIGALGFVFKLEIYAIYALIFIVAIAWVLMRDVSPTFLAMAIIGMTPLARYGQVDYFDPLYPILIFMIPAMGLHLLFFGFKFHFKRFFFPTLSVMIAILLGGLFSPYFFEGFRGASLYYVIGLSVGMLAVYFILENYLPLNDKHLPIYFSQMMIGVGVMGVIMVLSAYYENWETVIVTGPGQMFQWRNNLSNNLLLSMPFAFYLAIKSRFTAFYFAIGVLQFLALLFSFSRGGMIFGTLTFPLLFISTLYFAKGERIKLIFTFTVVFAVVYLVFEHYVMPFTEVLSIMRERIQISADEARANLLRLALRNFRDYPIFGTGLGFDTSEFYNPQPMAMYWYHSTFSQVLGGLGLLGVFAYTYQELVRLYTLWEKKIQFNLYVLIALIGFSGYSMVNVGYFVPLPFVAMVIHMFMVSNRYNKTVSESLILSRDEAIFKAKAKT